MSNQYALTNNAFIRITVGSMAPRMKRLVYLSSLAALITNTTELDVAIANKLNTVLKLASTGTGSIRLPVLLNKVIWANKQIIQQHIDQLKTSYESVCSVASLDAIIASTPSWIMYDTPDTIKSDLGKLFCKEENLLNV
jgi:hypothetical protein